jgi:peroxiredoxin
MRLRASFRFCLALMVMLFIPCLPGNAMEGPASLTIGAAAPDFRLPGIDGKSHTLHEYDTAKLLVLVFTANHCPTAQAYEERIQKLYSDYKDKGVALVAISPNDPLAVRLDELGFTDLGDSLEDMKLRAKDKGFAFPYLYDGETQAASRQYGPIATPHVFIFDALRKLRFSGRIDDNENPVKATTQDARDAIEALLAGKPVPQEKTKVFGCSIKWSEKRASVQEGFAKWAQEPVSVQPIDVEGVKALVKNDSDKLRLINVWATWCGPCTVEFPELISIHRMYRGREFEVITISSDPTTREQALKAFLSKQQASTKNYHFQENTYDLIEAADPKWEGAIPYTLLVAPGGKVLYRCNGAFDSLALKKAIVGWLGRYFHSVPGK